MGVKPKREGRVRLPVVWRREDGRTQGKLRTECPPSPGGYGGRGIGPYRLRGKAERSGDCRRIHASGAQVAWMGWEETRKNTGELRICAKYAQEFFKSEWAVRNSDGISGVNLAAADVRRLILFPRGKSEPTYIGCYGSGVGSANWLSLSSLPGLDIHRPVWQHYCRNLLALRHVYCRDPKFVHLPTVKL